MRQKNFNYGPHAVPNPGRCPVELIEHCRTYRDAIRVGLRCSNTIKTENGLADALGMSRGHLSQILNKTGDRKRYLDPDRFVEVESLLGNYCITQFFEAQADGRLKHQRTPELSTEDKAALYDQMMQERKAG